MDSLAGKFCRKPFEHFEINSRGDVSLCCYTWLPKFIGRVTETSSVSGVFNSDIAKEIRMSIHDGSFKYCNHTLCPLIQNGSLPLKSGVKGPRMQRVVAEELTDNLSPDFYNLCYDESCNLQCPSCRMNKISYTSGHEYELREKIQNQIIKDLFETPHTRNCTVNITGSGDPFGSKLFRELLFKIDGKNFPRLNINLQTNGVMFTEKYWAMMHKIHGNINSVIVSYDAGTKETYGLTREGGDWEQLQENMEVLSSLRRRKLFRWLRIDFVVQQSNYREMSMVVGIGKRLDVDRVYFSRVVNWGAWDDETYQNHAVWLPSHPEYSELVNMLKSDCMNDGIVDLGNLTGIRDES